MCTCEKTYPEIMGFINNSNVIVGQIYTSHFDCFHTPKEIKRPHLMVQLNAVLAR